MSVDSSRCPGCGVVLPAGATGGHPYMPSSPACWARYGALLAAQYANAERMRFHQLIVDAYAVQHPDGDDPRAISSVGLHLMTLCLFVERGVDPALGTRLHRRMVRRPVFTRLEAPPSRGMLTVLDVPTEANPNDARTAAFEWAGDAWAAWAPHHDTVRTWLRETGFGAE